MKTQTYIPLVSLALALGAMTTLPVLTGCAGDRYHQSTGESIDDEGISMRVRSALSDDPEYKYGDVKVTTFKGTVQLSGFVDNKAQMRHAAEIAKGVAGVQDVQNNITVKE